MRRAARAVLFALVAGPLAPAASTGLQHHHDAAASSRNALTKNERLEFIRRAQVWQRTDIRSTNIRAGPGGDGAFQPDESVTCDYAGVPKHGTSRKFYCSIGGTVVKVRYGSHNREVEASVVATRLLWALGFAADRVYPVRVRCRGCSSDPWKNHGGTNGVYDFDPAVIERKPPGREMREGSRKAGWSWSELDLVDENQGGAPRPQLDALRLLAVLMQHSDTRSHQQRLLCLSPDPVDAGLCDKPFLMLHDVGLTFGRANTFNRNGVASVNLDEWSRTPVWKNAPACIGQLSRSISGTVGDPRISEAGRKFLADLLMQLDERQIHDLFDTAHVDRRAPDARVEDWVAAFNRKRLEIVTNRCAY
jgi:hypothetical protein